MPQAEAYGEERSGGEGGSEGGDAALALPIGREVEVADTGAGSGHVANAGAGDEFLRGPPAAGGANGRDRIAALPKMLPAAGASGQMRFDTGALLGGEVAWVAGGESREEFIESFGGFRSGTHQGAFQADRSSPI